MEQEYKHILEQNRIEQINDFAEVQTYANYVRNHANNASKALFVKKTITLDNSVIAFLGTSIKSQYVINGGSETLSYLSFFLNSIWGRVSMIPPQDIKIGLGQTNLSLIKKTSIVRNATLEPYCILIDRIIAFLSIYLSKYRDVASDHSDTIKRLFENLRNSIVMELVLPKIFEKNDVSVLYPWMQEVKAMEYPEDIGEFLSQIVIALFKPGNQLMENMNRMRLFITQFTEFMNEYYGKLED